MIHKRLKKISDALSTFTGTGGEPKGDAEIYILNSLWVMLCAEFESCLKEAVEGHIDYIKAKKKITDVNVCLLIQNCYGDGKEKDNLTAKKIIGLFKKDISCLTYENFTKNKISRYKPDKVEELLNFLGIFISEQERAKIKMLQGIGQTRDSIAHGDFGTSITRKELESNIKEVEKIYQLLRSKLLPKKKAIKHLV